MNRIKIQFLFVFYCDSVRLPYPIKNKPLFSCTHTHHPSQEMKATLEHLSQHKMLADVDALAVAILSHGDAEHVSGIDNLNVKVGSNS